MSDVSFVPNSDYLLMSRDYLSAKLWDLRKASNAQSSGGMIVDTNPNPVLPIYSAQVTDYLERNLANQLEQDALDDQFFLSVSPDG